MGADLEGQQCSVCEQGSKYRCPGCGARSCSLECSKVHKANTGTPAATVEPATSTQRAHPGLLAGCSGKRDRTAFAPLTDFSDATLRSDYFLLEGAQRSREAARRALMKSKDAPASHSQTHDLIREVREEVQEHCSAASRQIPCTGWSSSMIRVCSRHCICSIWLVLLAAMLKAALACTVQVMMRLHSS